MASVARRELHKERHMICFFICGNGPVLAPPPLINGIVLLFPLSIFDKNDDNSNNNHVPSMVISIKDVVGAPSKFLAISSTDPEGGGGYDNRRNRLDSVQQGQ